jgi:hypothetical protein
MFQVLFFKPKSVPDVTSSGISGGQTLLLFCDCNNSCIFTAFAFALTITDADILWQKFRILLHFILTHSRQY